MCQSVCANFFRVCGHSEDLWRCSNLVGKAPAAPSTNNQETFFPGEPFKANEYKGGNEPKEVCTPSIKGAANSIQLSVLSIGVIAFVCASLALV